MARRVMGPMQTSVSPGGSVLRGREGGVSVRAYIRGGPEMARKLAAIRRDLAVQGMVQAVLAGADVLAVEWRARVPVFEGHYRNSITAVASQGKEGATGLVYPADVPGVPDNEQPRRYAARLEFGSAAQTKRMLKRGIGADPGRRRRPQPSLRPAFDNVKGQMVDAIGSELRHVIEKTR